MAVDVEVLKDPTWGSRAAAAWPDPCVKALRANGLTYRRTSSYEGCGYWLTVFGAGHPTYDEARHSHLSAGKPVACWDVGYFGKCSDKALTYFRVSIGSNHPSHRDLDLTPPDPSRWERLRIPLRELADPKGPVLVIGMGPKSRVHLKDDTWEERMLKATAERFEGRRRIIYRPKRPGDGVLWPSLSLESSVYDAMAGASLVICRHSNVALDACVAGVPVECEDGAAHWLYHKHSTPSVSQRLDLLYRVAWWQWRLSELEEAWKFLLRVHSARFLDYGST